MKQRLEPDIDIISDLLKAVIAVRPDDSFCISLLHQYRERGGLSKKQLEGLLGKATKFTDSPPGKLATLEAIILKKHTNHKSAITVAPLQDDIDERSPALVEAILKKYPNHKRVLFFKLKLENREQLSDTEKEELNRFTKFIMK